VSRVRRHGERASKTTIQTRSSPPYTAFDGRLRQLGLIEGESFAWEFIHPDNENGFTEAERELIRRKMRGGAHPAEAPTSALDQR
jgi:hypothetical protein